MPKKKQQIENRYGKPLAEILTELIQVHGKQQEVAKVLGVGNGTVSRWMQQCGLKTEYRAVLKQRAS